MISYRLLGFENRAIADQDFRDDTRDAGEVGAGQSSTVLYEVTLDHRWDRSRGPIATATLRHRGPACERITEMWASLLSGDVERSFRDVGAHFRLAVVAAEFAGVLRDSPSWRTAAWRSSATRPAGWPTTCAATMTRPSWPI